MDVHSFVDKASHLTTVVFRLRDDVTVLRQCWESVGMTRTNREV